MAESDDGRRRPRHSNLLHGIGRLPGIATSPERQYRRQPGQKRHQRPGQAASRRSLGPSLGYFRRRSICLACHSRSTGHHHVSALRCSRCTQ
ncbi:uncharacterized protein LY79DRAFT_539141 [Colletotrichum navitas]|uniref:Uncharacterized protein n=1 Tax=Colletotrichum navitas TaxID=681940 RepID=A0AAD8Q9A4_9PEZI|nr:uncharacterized protein LY79DRAFT_539141 [Colletotrichum navitas]KAK1598426.1 hypothetical protein LY79DRAFT_539141 [Colletotrichum navitas]